MEKLCKIRNIQRCVTHFELDFEKQYGISLNEGMVLCSLSKKSELSSGEIGDLLALTSSNTSKVINSAEKKGLIKRVIGTKDKRQMFFTLTEQGSSLLSSLNCDKIISSELLNNLISAYNI